MSTYPDEFKRLEEENTTLKTEIEQLKKRDQLLTALEMAGVDNWEGYDMAIDLLESED